ncbi:hypothetical protein NSY55_26875, partial [Pseudomonas aeruginosa]|nr:hypothetical protein [Pseudomonas aeruginosa]
STPIRSACSAGDYGDPAARSAVRLASRDGTSGSKSGGASGKGVDLFLLDSLFDRFAKAKFSVYNAQLLWFAQG